HDLGFYELLFTIALTAVLFWFARKPRRPGQIIALAALAYAPARFGFDFLRAVDVARPDVRYAALTPAQWAYLATAGLGAWLLFRPPSPASSSPPDQGISSSALEIKSS